MKADFHTHSTFCDGKDTPAEMCARALELGFEALGFTGHSFTDFDPCGMSESASAVYRAEIARLKKEYAGRMELYCGVDAELEPQDGERLLEMEGLEFSLEDGLLTAVIDGADGTKDVLRLSLRSGKEGGA